MPRIGKFTGTIKEGDRHANFHLSEEMYKKFRLLAAERGISITALYKTAAEEFLERQESVILQQTNNGMKGNGHE